MPVTCITVLGVDDTLASRLKSLREAAGLTQQDLREKSRVDVMTISRIERGENTSPKFETIERLAMALGVGPTDLWVAPEPPADWAATVERYLASRRGQTTPEELRQRLRRFVVSAPVVDMQSEDHVHHARVFLEAVWQDDHVPAEAGSSAPLAKVTRLPERESRVVRDNVRSAVRMFVESEPGLSEDERSRLLAMGFKTEPTAAQLREKVSTWRKQGPAD